MHLEHYKDQNIEYWYYLDKEGNGIKIYHRDDDLPSVIWSDGDKFWYQHGKEHRENGAAIELSNGDLGYWYHGKYLGRSYEGYTKEQFEQYKKLIIFL